MGLVRGESGCQVSEQVGGRGVSGARRHGGTGDGLIGGLGGDGEGESAQLPRARSRLTAPAPAHPKAHFSTIYLSRKSFNY